MCPGDIFVLYWWCLDTELDVIEHLKLFNTRGIPILTTLTVLSLIIPDHFFLLLLWMRYCSEEILPWNRWQTDILICMEQWCLYCLKSEGINCFLSQNNLRFRYLNASVIKVEIFTFLSNTPCVFPKKPEKREIPTISLPILPWTSELQFQLLLFAYCLEFICVFGSASSQRHTLFGVTRRCLALQQAHIESLPGKFISALLGAVVFSIQACVSLVLVSCIRVNFPWEK